MGFDLYLHRLDGGDGFADADRSGIERFVRESGLRMVRVPPLLGGLRLEDENGKPLAFDGRETSLCIDPLDSDEPVGASIDHATLTDAECSFVYQLCVAGGMLCINPQGPPMLVVPVGTHTIETASVGAWPDDASDIAWVSSAAEFQAALADDYEEFLAYKRRVIGEHTS